MPIEAAVLPEDVSKWVMYLNVGLGVALKLGGAGFVLKALWKALDWMDGKVQHGLELGKKKANEYKLLQQTLVDDVLFDTLKGLSYSTFKTIKGTLKTELEDGKISEREFREALHEDVKENFKRAVSTGKRALFEAAYEDIDAVIDVMLPGVIKTAKEESRMEAAGAEAVAGLTEGNS